ncbi:HTTM domain-containing protein [Corynebacterium hindlerae]|uniref:HTTM domain-containing protein n=1 Tax=Corynebacterium hindlerae TaxID=699041 RepID=UPI003AAFF95D
MSDSRGINPRIFALVRTILAFSTIFTIAGSRSAELFLVDLSSQNPVRCLEIQNKINLFCLMSRIEYAQIVAVFIGILVASGYFARTVSLFHAWLSFSFFNSIGPLDGGDQVNAIFTLLLVGVAFLYPKGNLWRLEIGSGIGKANRFIADASILLIMFQCTVIYIDAGLGKLNSEVWHQGSAIWYWAQHPQFGVSASAIDPVLGLLSYPLISAFFTWGTIALEVFIAIAIYSDSKDTKRIGLMAGIIFYSAIAVIIGLWSFSLTMIALLIFVFSVKRLEEEKEPHDDSSYCPCIPNRDGILPVAGYK